MEKLLLGTYTRNISNGIYQIILDENRQELCDLQLVANTCNPTYLTIDNNLHLYSVYNKNDKSGIYSFDRNHIPFTEIDSKLNKEGSLCHISVDNERKLLFSSSYHEGKLYVYKFDKSGHLTLTDTIIRHGSSIHPNQTSSHVHYADLTPENRLIVCDLGTDEIILYNISNIGKLEEISTFKMPEGSGPRHLVFHPQNPNICYVLGELNNTIYTLQYNDLQNSFTIIESVSIANLELAGGAAIKISKDGKFLYASTRGNNTISVLSIIKNGQDLKLIQTIDTHGDGPRDFTLSSNNQYLIVGHQYSNNLTLFKRSLSDGTLTMIQKNVKAPETVCLISLEN